MNSQAQVTRANKIFLQVDYCQGGITSQSQFYQSEMNKNLLKGTLSLELIFLYMRDITFLNAIHMVKYSISTPFTFRLAD